MHNLSTILIAISALCVLFTIALLLHSWTKQLALSRNLRETTGLLEQALGERDDLRKALNETLRNQQSTADAIREAFHRASSKAIAAASGKISSLTEENRRLRSDSETAKQLTSLFEDFIGLIRTTEGLFRARGTELCTWRKLIPKLPSLHYWVRTSDDEAAAQIRARCKDHPLVTEINGDKAICAICAEPMARSEKGHWIAKEQP